MITTYGISTFFSAFTTSLKSIEAIQNSLMRRLRKRDTVENVGDLYENTGILPIRKLFLKCLLTECLIRNPGTLLELIESLKPFHEYPTLSTKIRPTNWRLVRSDKMYLNRFVGIYRESPDAVDAILAAERVSQKRRKTNH